MSYANHPAAWRGRRHPLVAALDRARRNLTVEDGLCLAYHAFMLLRVLVAPDGVTARSARLLALALLALAAALVTAVRGELLPAGRRRAFCYRLGLLGSIVLSYFELALLLPALQPTLLDAQLLRIDRWLFGTTPALWLQRFNTRPVVEWFAFFYWSYFLLLALVLLPSLLIADETVRRLQRGAMIVACVGHISYTFVPGIGPHATLAFVAPLDGGHWWQLVQSMVAGGGAQLDIFPSLHTAYPSYFALFAFVQRHRPGYRHAWPLLAFFALNIIVATMLLRWHYGIDVLCGLLLAQLAVRLSGVKPRPGSAWRPSGSACGAA